jgi:hypothetical protein
MGMTVDKIADGLATTSTRLVIDKASISSQTAGSYVSLWRATGQPAQGAIPTSAAVCNESLSGGFSIPQQTAPIKSYLGFIEAAIGNASQTLELHDRLMHMGGLSGTVTTAQTVNLDLDANLATDDLTDRIGDSDYSDVQWWMEWYTATGSSAVTATVNVTYSDGSTGNLSAISLAATRPASHMINLNVYRPAAVTAHIRDINSVTLSVTTGTAGNFGFTATRLRGTLFCPIANAKFSANWADIPISEVPQSACLFPMLLTSTTTSGTVRGGGKVMHIDPS